MRTYLTIAVLALAAACSGPKKPAGAGSPIVTEGSGVPDSCCCKSQPMTSEDGKPAYEANTNRMECSTKQGECVADVQCQQTPAP
ncbi:MAG: hypothetical protein KF773_00745 [Deltaproteobacteria bacterium]|nr:hypothetical protein [Deltaproteobacteria bacterium]MCW5803657.1 hypothetical protein [Deltaproteobacteria bacterium]